MSEDGVDRTSQGGKRTTEADAHKRPPGAIAFMSAIKSRAHVSDRLGAAASAIRIQVRFTQFKTNSGDRFQPWTGLPSPRSKGSGAALPRSRGLPIVPKNFSSPAGAINHIITKSSSLSLMILCLTS